MLDIIKKVRASIVLYYRKNEATMETNSKVTFPGQLDWSLCSFIAFPYGFTSL